jgi:acyl-CoA carboxylase subunit beta
MVRIFGRQHSGEPEAGSESAGSPLLCDKCGKDYANDPQYSRLKVCPQCGHHHPLTAYERISILADPGTFKETLAGMYPTDPLGFVDKLPYSQRLEEARRKTGLADAAVTGSCQIEGQAAMLAVLDFRFLGGSMGSVVGEKIAAACELAIKRRIPLVAVTCSGGARMQEGMLSLAQMAKTAAAVERLHASRIPFFVILCHPTTGGVYASFGTLGDVLIAEPAALISFAGPRVAKAFAGEGEDKAPRSAEALVKAGQIDAVVPRARSRALIGELIRLTAGGRARTVGRPNLPPPSGGFSEAWPAVERARHGNRPTSMDYLRRIASSLVEIHGDRTEEDDPAVVCGVADLDGQAVMIVAQERGHPDSQDTRGGHMSPSGYRKARRAMLLAAKWRLPVLTMIDTPGADMSAKSEAGGMGGAISRSMALMSDLPTPILTAVIGEGGSGGALALAVADRVIMMENAIFSVIAPEGAAAIIYRDPSQAPSVALSLKLTSHDVQELGIADVIVPEPEGGAHLDHERAALMLRRVIREELAGLMEQRVSALLHKRYERWRHVGKTTSATAVAAGKLAEQMQTGLKEGPGKIAEQMQAGIKEGRERLAEQLEGGFMEGTGKIAEQMQAGFKEGTRKLADASKQVPGRLHR